MHETKCWWWICHYHYDSDEYNHTWWLNSLASRLYSTAHYGFFIAVFFSIYRSHTARPLTHWGRDQMAAIFLTTYSNGFFVNDNAWISINISLKFVPRGPINNIPALVQIMAWRRPGDKLLSEPMMVRSLTHICVTRPQWVKGHIWCHICSYFIE